MNVILGGSLIVSLVQTMLFWDRKPGISVVLFVTIAISILIYILKINNAIKNKKAVYLMIPIMLLSSTYFIFNNLFFQMLNGVIIAALVIIMCIYLIKPEQNLIGLLQNIVKVTIGSLECIEEVTEGMERPKVEEDKKSKIKKIVKSIAVGFPIILIVLLLLISADTIFANLFSGAIQFFENLATPQQIFMLVVRIGMIALVFLLSGGFLINLIKKNTLFTTKEESKQKDIKIEHITINTILTILNSIYFVFCFIQITNLFTTVGNNPEFNYAEYARQGFFQLMFVSFINFIVIFIANCNQKEKTVGQKKYTKFMNIVMIIATIIIILSAFYRMNLYEQEYGYTYLRLFVYFILATELLLMVPTMLYCIGKKINVLRSSLIIGITMYVILNFVNIDALIAKRNIDRYFEKEDEIEIDLSYLMQNTDTDAIQEIERLLNAKNKQIVERTKEYLYHEKEKLQQEKMYWQEMNLSKIRAKQNLAMIHLEKQ